MTKYAYQNTYGELETLSMEHPNPKLLFSDRTAFDVTEVLNSEPFTIPFDLYRHLHDVHEANDSHRANYWLEALRAKASEYGRTIIDCIDGLPNGIREEFTNDTLSKAKVVIPEQLYSD